MARTIKIIKQSKFLALWKWNAVTENLVSDLGRTLPMGSGQKHSSAKPGTSPKSIVKPLGKKWILFVSSHHPDLIFKRPLKSGQPQKYSINPKIVK